MSDRKIIQINKKITAPLIIQELELMHQETGQEFLTIVYNCVVDKVHERIKQREFQSRPFDDLTVNKLKTEINTLLEKYERQKYNIPFNIQNAK